MEGNFFKVGDVVRLKSGSKDMMVYFVGKFSNHETYLTLLWYNEVTGLLAFEERILTEMVVLSN
ncbi:DUF2158 domain-containing protein [Paenimyroides ceti]|jgi:uncharacterized protein YodC (DUF2158 family)